MEQNITKADVKINLNGQKGLDVWYCVTQAKSISSLEIAGPLNERELKKLNNFPHLCSLTMLAMPTAGKAFRDITNLKYLNHLKFRHCGCIGDFFSYVQNVCSLETLVVVKAELKKPNFENLIHLRNLNLLDMHDCSLEDETMMLFPKISSLSCLVLDSNRLTGESFSFIGKLKNLKELSLLHNPVTEKGLEVIAAAGCNSLEGISLFDAKISDKGLVPLLQMKKLKSLGLTGCNITDKSLPLFTKMRDLRSLMLHGTHITFDSVKSL